MQCNHKNTDRDDYVNPCSNAACKMNGQHTYHLGCGAQWKVYCLDCGVVLEDSAQDEIDQVKWKAIEYRCNACSDEVQPGHFACGQIFYIPEYQREKEAKEQLVDVLIRGMSPDDAEILLGQQENYDVDLG